MGLSSGTVGKALIPPTHTHIHTRARARTHAAGVDLSSGMVGKARARGCYDALTVGELVAFLEGTTQPEAGGAAGSTAPAPGSASVSAAGGAAAAVGAGGPQQWQCLVAADVFVYIGDLAPVMRAAAAASTPG